MGELFEDASGPRQPQPDPEPVSTAGFEVRLIDPGRTPIQVVRLVHEITGLPLRESRQLVDGAPALVTTVATEEEARSLLERLAAAGAWAFCDGVGEYQPMPQSRPTLPAIYFAWIAVCAAAGLALAARFGVLPGILYAVILLVAGWVFAWRVLRLGGSPR